MRVNQENKSVDIEQRDINYVLPAYVRSYLFYSKNEMPEKIIFPMFSSVLVQGKEIPIEYVPPLDAIAVEIAKDGAEVVEVTPEEEAALDEKDDRVKQLKEEVATLETGHLSSEFTNIQEVDKEGDEMSPAKAAFAEHIAEELATGTDATGSEYPEPEAEAVPPTTDRQPKQPPGGDIGPGSALSDMQARDRRDQIRTTRDLMEEPDIDEAEEKEYEKPISRDEEGKPVVSEDEKEG